MAVSCDVKNSTAKSPQECALGFRMQSHMSQTPCARKRHERALQWDRERERERAYLDIVVEAAVIAEPGTSGHNVGFSTDSETSGHEFCEVLAQHLLAGLLWAAEILHAFELGRRR